VILTTESSAHLAVLFILYDAPYWHCVASFLLVKEAKQELLLHQERMKRATDADKSSSALGDNSSHDRVAEALIDSATEPPSTKKTKFFDFMTARGNLTAWSKSGSASQQTTEMQSNLNKQFYDLHHSVADAASGLAIFNEPKLFGLRPLAQRLFSAPAGSAAIERVFFSQAGLIMKPMRNRLAKDRLALLVFLKCNMKQ
jgi:hypothetical protein